MGDAAMRRKEIKFNSIHRKEGRIDGYQR